MRERSFRAENFFLSSLLLPIYLLEDIFWYRGIQKDRIFILYPGESNCRTDICLETEKFMISHAKNPSLHLDHPVGRIAQKCTHGHGASAAHSLELGKCDGRGRRPRDRCEIQSLSHTCSEHEGTKYNMYRSSRDYTCPARTTQMSNDAPKPINSSHQSDCKHFLPRTVL